MYDLSFMRRDACFIGVIGRVTKQQMTIRHSAPKHVLLLLNLPKSVRSVYCDERTGNGTNHTGQQGNHEWIPQ